MKQHIICALLLAAVGLQAADGTTVNPTTTSSTNATVSVAATATPIDATQCEWNIIKRSCELSRGAPACKRNLVLDAAIKQTRPDQHSAPRPQPPSFHDPNQGTWSPRLPNPPKTPTLRRCCDSLQHRSAASSAMPRYAPLVPTATAPLTPPR